MAPDPKNSIQRIDVDRPNSARLYDCYLGGSHNTAADRALAQRITAGAPRWPVGAQLNRSFLRNAVRFMARQGIDQFLDLGSGIPTVGNVHEIAQQENPIARVVYVDYESVAYNAAKAMLATDPNTTILFADIREPDSILNHPKVQELIDFSRPVGLLIVGVLLFISPVDRPKDIVTTYRKRLAPGSYLALSHPCGDDLPPDIRQEIDHVLACYENADEQVTLRSYAEISSWFEGTELVEPGLVTYPYWRTDESTLTYAQRTSVYGYVGVGRVR